MSATTRPGCINCETGEYEEDKAIPYNRATGGNDDSMHAEKGSSVNRNTLNVLDSNKNLILGIFMAFAIVEGAALFYEWRHKSQQEELKRYELSDFQATHFNPLEAKVLADHDLIQAYGLQKTIIEACKR